MADTIQTSSNPLLHGLVVVNPDGTSVASSSGGTEYTDGGTPPANPVGGTLQWNEGGTWRTVSAAKPLPVTASISTAGLATDTKQDTLLALTETLQELIQRLAPLASIISSTAALRVTPIASVSTAVTGSVTATGGGYITSAQSITEKALGGVSYPEKVAMTNLNAVQSNINNVVGA